MRDALNECDKDRHSDAGSVWRHLPQHNLSGGGPGCERQGQRQPPARSTPTGGQPAREDLGRAPSTGLLLLPLLSHPQVSGAGGQARRRNYKRSPSYRTQAKKARPRAANSGGKKTSGKKRRAATAVPERKAQKEKEIEAIGRRSRRRLLSWFYC